MSNLPSSAANAVAAGAVVLDSVMPGWESRIDLDRLDLNDEHECVLGQLWYSRFCSAQGLRLYASLPYSRGVEELFDGVIKKARNCGFIITSQVEWDAEELTQEWRTLIRSRLERRTSAPALEQELDMDAFIEHWGDNLQSMYENRTAGDHSFTGFVASLLLDLQRRGVQIF